MTAPKRKVRANGEGTIYQRKDGRWEAAGYVLAADGGRKRVRVYGSTRKSTADKLAEKIADSTGAVGAHRGLRALGAQVRPGTRRPRG